MRSVDQNGPSCVAVEHEVGVGLDRPGREGVDFHRGHSSGGPLRRNRFLDIPSRGI
jgi:hypothetical protein